VSTRPGRDAYPLDDISQAIIEQLRQNGRRPYAGIGQAVGLSEAAVRQRVQRLIEAGVMQIVAVTDPVQLGFALQAMIGIRADGDLAEVAERIGQLSEVDSVIITAGSFDVLAAVVCEDEAHLLSVITEGLRSIPGVRTTEAFVYLKLAKQPRTGGTRRPAARRA
jgi:Lrp/AsnC family transcriptional regulator for asnA, asnC and gidA